MRIAISAFSGCGNTTVSNLVAKKLGLKVFNYTFRDIAKEKGLSLEEIHEKARNTNEFDLLLDKTLASYAVEHDDFVIAARLPIWLDDEKLLEKVGLEKKPFFDLKVWLGASLDVRSQRIAKREGKNFEQARKETLERDRENAERYNRLYGIDMEKHGFADLVIDTEKHSLSEIVEMIVSKAEQQSA